jgi:ribosomal protein L11 methyltransferase
VTESETPRVPWIQLTLDPGEHSVEAREAALLASGAVAVTLQDGADDPVLEPLPGETPLWSRTRVTGLYDGRALDLGRVERILCRELGSGRLPSHRVSPLEDRDWVRAWMDHYHPMRFGPRLWVCPSHLTPPDTDATTIMMDPGLAFGTGTHATTALCLEWLSGHDVTGWSVIDYGCGSGILAIGALLLGAKQALAVDIDPQALSATRDNAGRNAVGDRVETALPDRARSPPADLVMANILAGPLAALRDRLTPLVRPGGRLIMSGLLSRHADEIEHAYAGAFEFRARRAREDWMLLDGIRRSGSGPALEPGPESVYE